MIQKVKSKQELRQEMDQAVAAYLQQGGDITQVQQGVSGRDDNANINYLTPFTPSEQTTRTLVNDTVKTLDERKQKKKPAPQAPKKPQKKIIYDDFGEPIREIWE